MFSEASAVGELSAERLEVERVAAREVLEAAAELRGARGVDAPRRDLAIETRDGSAAHRALRRHAEDLLRPCALLGNRRLYRGDHVSRLDEPDMVADPDVLPRDLVGVVERRAGYHGPRERNGLKLRDGREDPGAPDLDRYRLDGGLSALGRVLVGAGPARTVRGRAEDRIEPALVDLHDRAVDLEAESVAERLQLVYRSEDLLDRLAEPRPRRDRKAPRLERRNHLAVRGEVVASDSARVVEDHVERTLRGDARVELLERAGAGVPRIRERLESGGLLALVERGESVARHVRLAAHLEFAGRVLGKSLRN